MKLLVELLDRNDALNNILAVHAFRPEGVVYLHDPGQDGERFSEIRAALLRRYPQMAVRAFPVSYRDVPTIEAACRALAESGEETPVFDLTGGDPMAVQVVGRFCTLHSVPRFLLAGDPAVYTDLGGAERFATDYAPPVLSFEDLAEAAGSTVSGNMHRMPAPEQYDAIRKFFRLTMEDPSGWRQYCNYLQEVTNIEVKDSQGRIVVDAPAAVQSARHKTLHNDPKFAGPAAQAGFLQRYRAENGRVHFSYADKAACYYMITQGVWLEMFLYISAVRLGGFHDCRMSVLFDWDGDSKEPGNVVNEIDVVLLREFTPLFISCKTSVPSTADLNEIYLYAKRFGGSHARAALATTAFTRQVPLAVRNRAADMGVDLLPQEQLSHLRLAEYFSKSMGCFHVAAGSGEEK